jgi:flagellar hook-associated protein 1 FlgK
VRLAAFPDQPIASHNDESITTVYDRLVAETTQDSMVAHALADGARAFEQTLDGEKLAMSGVNIDEEAIMMINLQKAFQASARYIATLTDMLDMLVSL